MNRLADEVSPYLVQHATNPVHWWSWTPEAFAEAQQKCKPILLSVGYSACHWCHVMAHESFENAETAELMNDLFVNIKVDREERPDVDQTYMTALHALGQQGGWPLTMFLRPDGKPFWGGTYFPDKPRYGQAAFADVLRSVAKIYASQREDVDHNARVLTTALVRQPAAAGQTTALSLSWLDDVATRVATLYDPLHGGLKTAPKFPNPPVLELLWRAGQRNGAESSRQAVLLTLERMARGGIFDHIGGGFARYSVDNNWLVPHFEKMLYDNAQLISLLALAVQDTSSSVLRHALEMTVDWLVREMTTPSGAFAASLDADSADADGHMHEGLFYLWKPSDVAQVLADEAESFCSRFDISDVGNFEGYSIPNLLHDRGLSEAAPATANQLLKLRTARSQRSAPARDDKVLADWNGLAIRALAQAGQLLERPDWIALARDAFSGLCTVLEAPDGSLGHAARNGRVVRPGYASDYAAMALAALALHDTDREPSLLACAERWATRLKSDYTTESNVIAMTAATQSDLPVRPAPTHDDATPNANGLATELYIRLFAATGQDFWLQAADALLEACTPAATANPFGHASILNALDLRLRRADIKTTSSTSASLMTWLRLIPFTNRTWSNEARSDAGVTICSADGTCALPDESLESLHQRIEAILYGTA